MENHSNNGSLDFISGAKPSLFHTFKHPSLPCQIPFPSSLLMKKKISKTKPQGELIDRVEFHVTATKDYVEQARGQLTLAEDYKSKARKVS